MNQQDRENLLIRMYVEIDDLLQAYKAFVLMKGEKYKERRCLLQASEVATIYALYHFSGYKCFKLYYESYVLTTLKSYFPNAPQYKVFLGYGKMSMDLMHLWILYKVTQSQHTGVYFIDSKKLPVCHIRRAHSHKVFKEVARKGKTSTGWFYGLKIHLVVNDLGEIVSFKITPGNVADNNKSLLRELLESLQGICVGDKGYQTTLFEFFYSRNLHIVVKPKRNAKRNLPQKIEHIKRSKQRALIESIFNILASILDIDHSRHRSVAGGIVNILSALVAYQFMDTKPSLPSYTTLKNVLFAA